MFNRHLTFAALATAAAICTAFGQSGAVSGTVRGADGKPAQGAQIRFEGKERSNFTTTTDAHGKYAYKGLPVGLYKISVLINGSPKSSVTVKTAAETARVDFDLKTSAKGVKHYVWVPARTGSRLGGGWVEVDSSGSPVGGTLNIDQGSGQAVRTCNATWAPGSCPPAPAHKKVLDCSHSCVAWQPSDQGQAFRKHANEFADPSVFTGELRL